VAPPETAQSRHALRAVSLLAVLLLARGVTLAGKDVPHSAWSFLAYTWQDVLAALTFYAIDARVRRPTLGWVMYAAAVIYISINVPVVRVLSTPLTWTILRAASGPLSDAVFHYVNAANVFALAGVAVAGLLLPLVLKSRMTRPPRRAPLGLGLLIVLAGVYASSRIDTRGLDRNAFGALIATALPRVNAAAVAEEDWRSSPFEPGIGADLTSLRGAMRGRNVVLVVLESTGARHLATYGSSTDSMPRLTQLARDAIVFERAYSAYPESIKGLFATLCSRYPAFDTAPEIYADVPCHSIASILRDAGYRTALFHSGRFVYLGMESVIERRGFDVLEDAGAIGGKVESSFGVDDAATVSRVLKWIDSGDRGAPFFVTYLPTSGHNPYTTTKPGPFQPSSDFWRYMNALHEGDEALGSLVDGLRARHLDTSTLLVIIGDHGEAFGEHPGNFAHTLFINEENVRIPFLVAAPGTIKGQSRIDRVASVIDTAPTILDLLGLASHASHQGASLLGPPRRMALFFTDYSLGWLGLVDQCWKYMYEVDNRRSRLFDICRDSLETVDRSPEEPERTARYRDRLRTWAAAQKERVRNRL
jgi:glucan phosphoethanolaminetransferase (alkaline phosphatase superfamily)